MYHVAYQINWTYLKMFKNLSFVYFQNTFIQSFFFPEEGIVKTNDPGHPALLLIRQNILNKCFSSSSAFVERHSLHSEILETLISPEFRHESPKFGLDMRVYRTLRPIFFFFFLEKLFWKELLDTLMWSKNWKCLKPYMQKSNLDLICCGKIKLELNMKIWPFHFKRKLLGAFNSHDNSLSKSNYSNGRDYQSNRSCTRIRKHVFLSRFQTTYLEQL